MFWSFDKRNGGKCYAKRYGDGVQHHEVKDEHFYSGSKTCVPSQASKCHQTDDKLKPIKYFTSSLYIALSKIKGRISSFWKVYCLVYQIYYPLGYRNWAEQSRPALDHTHKG